MKKNRKKSLIKQNNSSSSIKPILTIGVLTNDCARFLTTNLKSIANQKINFPYEIVIVDNASIDQTRNIIRNFCQTSSQTVRPLFLSKKTNLPSLYGSVWEHGKGDYITILNGSDFLSNSTALNTLLLFLLKNKEYSSACSLAQDVDIYGKALPMPQQENAFSGTEYMLRHCVNWTQPSYLHALMFRRCAIEKRRNYFEKLIQASIPFEMCLYYHLLNSGRIRVFQNRFYSHRIIENRHTVTDETPAYLLGQYKAILSLKKLSAYLYQKNLPFSDARLNVWKKICRQYLETRARSAKAILDTIYRLSDEKLLYRFWKNKIQIRLGKKKNGSDFSPEKYVEQVNDYLSTPSFPKIRNPQKHASRGNRPMVSIGMTVYNQEDYVAQAIESILAQKVNFDYEIVIAEDCSTDRTREIVKSYAKRYPQKIRLILQEKNVGLKAQSAMLRKECRGIYRTHLEGDDFWLTTDKLQKQVDFLENHPDYVAVTGKIKTVDEQGIECPFPYGNINTIYSFEIEYTLKHFEKWLLPSHTGALLYRNVYYDLDDKTRNIYESADIAGDRKTALFLTMQGRVYCMNEYISVRRIELNSKTNFTAMNTKTHPYSMIYKWMLDLESFAYDLKRIRIDLSEAREQQWIYAINFFFRNPSQASFFHVRQVYKMSDEKKLYRMLLTMKIIRKYKDTKRALGFGKTVAKFASYLKRVFVGILTKKDIKNHTMAKIVLNGDANK